MLALFINVTGVHFFQSPQSGVLSLLCAGVVSSASGCSSVLVVPSKIFVPARGPVVTSVLSIFLREKNLIVLYIVTPPGPRLQIPDNESASFLVFWLSAIYDCDRSWSTRCRSTSAASVPDTAPPNRDFVIFCTACAVQRRSRPWKCSTILHRTSIEHTSGQRWSRP